MSDALNLTYEAIDREHAHESAHTRRKLVKGASVALGTMGALGWASSAQAQRLSGDNYDGPNTPANIINVAATAEVLATIVNTIGFERVALDDVTKNNIAAAAREELIHYQVLTSDGVGAKALTTKIWVPNEVFSSKEAFLTTLVVGDQLFINAYLLGTTVFARPGNASPRLARIAAEFMGAEAVHRALALQSLGRPGNDRAFMLFGGREETPGLPSTGATGIYDITKAPAVLESFGFGFGKEGNKPGAFYEFDEVSKRTPNPSFVNTRTPE